jgi:glyoxylase-like metal-dependent hydrolase (beta-lactamase superfamily II)
MAERRTFGAGALDCVLVADGQLPYPPATLLANAPLDDLEPALAGDIDANGMLVGRFNPLLVRSPGGLILVDAGFGRLAPDPGAGRLHESLHGEGVSATDVDVVVVTHAHPDHVGGLVVDGDPAFPRARHVLLAPEWQFWSSHPAGLPEPLVAAAEYALGPLHERGLLELVRERVEVAPGVCLSHAPGHTPGHAVIELGDPPAALFLADAVLHEAGFAHPEWTSPIDSDPERAVETRRRLLERAAGEGLLVAGYHLRGAARVERRGNAFRIVEATSREP